MAAPLVYYCSLDQVKRILRSSAEAHVIRFSEALKSFSYPEANNLYLDRSGITVDDSYAGIEKFLFTFSDTSNFTLGITDIESLDYRYGGVGDTGTDFTSLESELTVESTAWIGSPVASDELSFETNSHMSNEDATNFIQDAEIWVDSFLQQDVTFQNINTYTRMFTTSIPSPLTFATCRLAASFIFSSIFVNNVFVQTGKNAPEFPSEAFVWFKDAVNVLRTFVRRYKRDNIVSAPRWIARESLIVGAGDEGVGEGIQMPRLDHFETVANMSYSGLFINEYTEYYGDITTNNDEL